MAWKKRAEREAQEDEQLRQDWEEEDSGTEAKDAERARQRAEVEEQEQSMESARQQGEAKEWEGGFGTEGDQQEDQYKEVPFQIDDNILRLSTYLPFDCLPPYDELCVISRNSSRFLPEIVEKQNNRAQQIGQQFVFLTQGRLGMEFNRLHTLTTSDERESRTFQLSSLLIHTNRHPTFNRSSGFKPIWSLEYSPSWKIWWDTCSPNTKSILLLIRGIDGFITSIDNLQELQTTASQRGISITMVFYFDQALLGFFTAPVDLRSLLLDDTA